MKREFMIDRQGKQAVLYAGLLDEAHPNLKSIRTQLIQAPTADNGNVAICFAEVVIAKSGQECTFTGLGDACPSNVGRMVAGHILRMAETRAKARALRDAINVGAVAMEELGNIEELDEHGTTSAPSQHAQQRPAPAQPAARQQPAQAPRPAAPPAAPARPPAQPVPPPAQATAQQPAAQGQRFVCEICEGTIFGGVTPDGRKLNARDFAAYTKSVHGKQICGNCDRLETIERERRAAQ